MIYEFTVSCADCGDPVEIEIDDQTGDISGGCYTGPLTADKEMIKDHAKRIDRYLELDVPEGSGVVVYTECESCCSQCDD